MQRRTCAKKNSPALVLVMLGTIAYAGPLDAWEFGQRNWDSYLLGK